MKITSTIDQSSPDVGEESPDVYFTAGYGFAAASARNGTWESAGGPGMAIPYVLNDAGEGKMDAVSPYGYSGVHVEPGYSEKDMLKFWSHVREYWRDLGVVAIFFRFSPLDEASVSAAARLPDVSLTRRGDTVAVDVSHGVNVAWEGMEGRSRTAVRKAEKAGYTGSLRPADDGDLCGSSPFREMYERTMKRVGSAPGYLFGDSYYVALRDGLGKNLMIAESIRPDGTTGSAALILAHGGRLHYHLAGSEAQAAMAGANNLLLWTVIRWAADTGRSVVHLGGGVKPEDGLFSFKRSFGGARTAYWTGASILDPVAYTALIEKHALTAGTTAAALLESGFFPAYRAGRGLV